MKHELIIKHEKGCIPVNFKELWAFRELLYFLAWRDIKVKYKQTALGLDFFIAFIILIGMMFFYQFTPSVSGILMIPVLIFLTFLVAVGCGLWLSALNVEYRDFQHVIPFIVQIWMFVTPVIYPVTLFPEKYRWMLSLNPMAGIIEAFRAATLGHQPVNWSLLGIHQLLQ
ncbi:MAG: ABC transporter permease [Thermodesulfovibrionales bacterium]|nr:ABC transporter permease [Thermodesulfovibrionales bacterium]